MEEKTRNDIYDYPLTLKVREVADILRVSLHKAYNIVKREDFPAIRDGMRVIIPRDAFFKWLNEASDNQTNPTHDR